jgi:hypothetical protein
MFPHTAGDLRRFCLHFHEQAGTLREDREHPFIFYERADLVMQQKYPMMFLKPGREASLRRGHPWLFSGSVLSVEGHPEPGDIVIAATHRGEALALGFYNPRCDIVFRLLTVNAGEMIDGNFWLRKVRAAVGLRVK